MELNIKYLTPALVGIVAMTVGGIAGACTNKNPVSCSEMHHFVTEELAKTRNHLQCVGSPSNCTGNTCATITNNPVTFLQQNCSAVGNNISLPDTNGKINLSPGSYLVSYSFSPTICGYNVGNYSAGVQVVGYVDNVPYLDSSSTWDTLSGDPTLAIKSLSGQFIVKVDGPAATAVNLQYFVQGTGFLSTSKFAIDANQGANICGTPNVIVTNGSSLSIQQIG